MVGCFTVLHLQSLCCPKLKHSYCTGDCTWFWTRATNISDFREFQSQYTTANTVRPSLYNIHTSTCILYQLEYALCMTLYWIIALGGNGWPWPTFIYDPRFISNWRPKSEVHGLLKIRAWLQVLLSWLVFYLLQWGNSKDIGHVLSMYRIENVQQAVLSTARLTPTLSAWRPSMPIETSKMQMPWHFHCINMMKPLKYDCLTCGKYIWKYLLVISFITQC